jgi:hypothetical protein
VEADESQQLIDQTDRGAGVPDYPTWTALERWSVIEAASLICGIDPREEGDSGDEYVAQCIILNAIETGHLEVVTGRVLSSPIFGFVRVEPFLAWARLHLTGLPDELLWDSNDDGTPPKLGNKHRPRNDSPGHPLKKKPAVALVPSDDASTEHVDVRFTGNRAGGRTEVRFGNHDVMFSDAEHATLVALARARDAEDPWWKPSGTRTRMRMHHLRKRLRDSGLGEIAAVLVERDGDGGSRLAEQFSPIFDEVKLAQHPDIETSRLFRGAAARRR